MSTPPLPSGVVTFVFTDIESSTRLYRRVGERYPALLARHHELLRSAWAEHGGLEVKTEGDAFLVAFSDPESAVRACAAGQRRLAGERWPDDAEIKVRMGVHLGVASPTAGDYVAYAVHQTARVVDAGHGGQIIVSPDVVAAIGKIDSLEIRPLGTYQVRDFDAPIELFEVAGAGWEPVDRQLRVRPADGHNLARPPGRLIGRRRELSDLSEAIGQHGLITLTGPGGIGKTRLAIELGLHVRDRMPDGVWFVSLDTIDSIELVPGAILDAVVASPSVETSPWAAVAEAVADGRLLLILDNCEHLLPDLAARLAPILAGAVGSTVLATSRTPLGLRNERLLSLGPLDSSSSGDRLPAAVSLFLDRAPATIALGDDPAATASIGSLCAELDGLPLAIELAAARAAVQTPSEMREMVVQGRPLLRGRDPTLPERHRTLEATLEWSYRLLDPVARAVLRHLSLLPGNFDLDTATTAAADDDLDPYDVPEAVWSLVDQSLVVPAITAGETRYRLLRTVRRFAGDLRSPSETEHAVARLSHRLLDLFGPAVALDRSDISRLDQEIDIIRALVDRNLGGPQETKQQLAVVIGRHHDMTGTFAVGIDEIRRLVAELPEPTSARVALLTLLADLELRLGRADQARSALDEASRLGDRVGRPEWDDAGVDRTAGEIALRQRDDSEARRIAESAMKRELSPRGRARISNLLGILRLNEGDLAGAQSAFEGELAAWTDLGHDFLRVTALGNVAEVCLRRDRPGEAARYQQQCLELAQQIGHQTIAAFCVVMAAQLANGAGDWEVAVRLQSAADEMLAGSGYVLYDFDVQARRDLLAHAEQQLGRQVFEQVLDGSSTVAPTDALQEASRVLGAMAS